MERVTSARHCNNTSWIMTFIENIDTHSHHDEYPPLRSHHVFDISLPDTNTYSTGTHGSCDDIELLNKISKRNRPTFSDRLIIDIHIHWTISHYLVSEHFFFEIWNSIVYTDCLSLFVLLDNHQSSRWGVWVPFLIIIAPQIKSDISIKVWEKGIDMWEKCRRLAKIERSSNIWQDMKLTREIAIEKNSTQKSWRDGGRIIRNFLTYVNVF